MTVRGREEHFDAIRARGAIAVEDAGGRHTAAVSTANPDDGQPVDLTVVATKAYDVEAALRAIPVAARRAPLLTVQNGIGTEETVLQEVEQPLLAASLTTSVEWSRPGEVKARTAGGIAVASVREAPAAAWATLLAAGGLRSIVCPDFRAMKWSKLLLNQLGNATAAILDLDPGVLLGNPRLFALERAMLLETAATMARLGLRPQGLPGYPANWLARGMRLPGWVAHRLLAARIAQGRGGKMPSLWWDLRSGRGRTEVEWLHGAVARAAAVHGAQAPINASLCRLVGDLATGRLPRTEFLRRPERLLAAVYAVTA